MTRTRSLLMGSLCALLAFAPTLGYAQVPPQPPPPPEAPPPPGYYPPPPPQYYAPPPPQYYAPPPPGYYPPPQQQYYAPPMPPPVERQPSNGVGTFITGLVLLPVGVVLVGTSVLLWNDSNACTSKGVFGCNNTQSVDIAGAAVMDVFGSAMIVMGAIFIPVGVVQMAKFSRWKKTHPQAQQMGMIDLGHGVSMTPSLGGGPSGGRAGLSVHF